jgi:hypothetical protein
VHLVEGNWGDRASARQAYQAAEAQFDASIAPISAATVSLLGGVDVATVKATRRRNFLRLQELLGEDNALTLTLTDDAVPFCYPMLPRRHVRREALAEAGIFVPTYWADCVKRGHATFAWEMDLAQRLLPLPIDHRYTPEDMERVAGCVLALSTERGR